MTDWEQQLKQRAATIRHEKEDLDQDIVNAHAAGLSWRDIGKAADVNHEWARQATSRITKRCKPKPPAGSP